MITASAEDLMRQASMTANEYFLKVVGYIDERFGEDYAEEHPELVIAMINASTADFTTASYVVAIQEAVESITGLVREMRDMD